MNQRLQILLLLLLGITHPTMADGVFTDTFLATRDGVPVQRLAPRRGASPTPPILAMAYDPQDRLLYIVDSGGGFSLNVDTGELVAQIGPEVPLHNSAGLAFDPVQRCLYLLAPDQVWCKLDLSLSIQSCVQTSFFVGHAGLAYDPGVDAFWAYSGSSTTLLQLLDRNAQVLSELDLSNVLDASRIESVAGVAFDHDAEAILIEANAFAGGISQLLTVSRSGELLDRKPLPDSGGFDGGLAWYPDALPESHLAARAGFLKDTSIQNYVLYTPPPALSVNGSIGDGCRSLNIPVGTPIDIFVDNPSPVTQRFLLFAFPGEALPKDLSFFDLPSSENDFGVPTFPMPFTDGDASRTILVSNATGRPSLGKGRFQTGPAPVSILIPQGISQPRTVTIQALFEFGQPRALVSNAIILHITETSS